MVTSIRAGGKEEVRGRGWCLCVVWKDSGPRSRRHSLRSMTQSTPRVTRRTLVCAMSGKGTWRRGGVAGQLEGEGLGRGSPFDG